MQNAILNATSRETGMSFGTECWLAVLRGSILGVACIPEFFRVTDCTNREFFAQGPLTHCGCLDFENKSSESTGWRRSWRWRKAGRTRRWPKCCGTGSRLRARRSSSRQRNRKTGKRDSYPSHEFTGVPNGRRFGTRIFVTVMHVEDFLTVRVIDS